MFFSLIGKGGGAVSDRPLRVLYSVRDIPNAVNPYVRLLTDSVARVGIEVVQFTWRRAFRGQYEVLHVHWPELMIAGRTRSGTVANALRMLVLLSVLRLRSVPVVWTVHNASPHEHQNGLVRYCMNAFRKNVSRYIVMNRASVAMASLPLQLVTYIPHGDYSAVVGTATPVGLQADHRILYFGLIRRYKNVPALVEAFKRLDDPSASLRLVGAPQPPELIDDIVRATVDDARISLLSERVSDEELVREISQARLVVLPYAEYTNSGSAILALSAGRPILMPETEPAVELQTELGDEWVSVYKPPLDADVLQRALDRSEALTGRIPSMPARDWSIIAHQHRQVYLLAWQSRLRARARKAANG